MINHPNRKKILFTLQDIRNASPCASGWTKLLKVLPPKSPMTTRLSLGDVAFANDASDALWCVRVLDWSDVSIRRRVIAGAVLPTVTRSLKFTSDNRVIDCVGAIERWSQGDDSVDLAAAEAAAAWAAAAWAASALAAAWAAARAELKQQQTDIITSFAPYILLSKYGRIRQDHVRPHTALNTT